MESIMIAFALENLFLICFCITSTLLDARRITRIKKSIDDMSKGSTSIFMFKDWRAVFCAVKTQTTPTHVKINSDNPAFLIVYKDE